MSDISNSSQDLAKKQESDKSTQTPIVQATGTEPTQEIDLEKNLEQILSQADNFDPSLLEVENDEDRLELPKFDEDLVKKYPKSNRKVIIEVAPFGLKSDEKITEKGKSTFISPHGVEFQGTKEYPEGTLLKIQVAIPDYWHRKEKFVEYSRIDNPERFRILAKVVKAENVGKRGKKKLVLAQTVNIDEVDEEVLKSFLQNG